ncbi:EAL domain-containing protein [bacterium]|nr:EAL domain-containing protein [bacterium]
MVKPPSPDSSTTPHPQTDEIQEAIAKHARFSERRITVADLSIQGGVAAFCATGATSIAAAVGPVSLAILALGVIGALRFRLTRSKAPPAWMNQVSILADFLLFYIVMMIFHWRPGQPPELMLEAPTFVFVFVLIALRAASFDLAQIAMAGCVAAIGWGVITVFTLFVAGGALLPEATGRHIAIQVEKIVAILLFSASIGVAVRRGGKYLRDAAAEAARVRAALARETELNARLEEESAARERANQKLYRAANFDPLTGLENRRAFLRRAAMAAAENEADPDRRFAIALVDLNRFRAFNDAFGRAAGDALIKGAGERLSRAIRDDEHLARIGPDEFAVLSNCSRSQACGEKLSARLSAAFEAPIVAEGRTFIAGVTVGAAAIEPGDRGGCVFAYADIALNEAKRGGRRGHMVHDPSTRTAIASRVALEFELREAPARGELKLHYQPSFNLADDRIAGWEALVRWTRNGGDLVSPARFIPIAEETGTIVDIGAWALDAATRDAARFRCAGAPEAAFMSVNVSPRQFADPETLLRAVRSALVRHPHLKLEVTESAIVDDPVEGLALLKSLHDFGALLALDDFGTGASSLSQLRRFPFATLKIDQSFVRDETPDGRAYLAAVVGLARALGLKTVAEGIETEADLVACRSIGVTYGQGFLLGRPVDAESVLRDLELPERTASAA